MTSEIAAMLLMALLIFGMVLVVLFIVLRARRQNRQQYMTAKEYEAKEEKLMMLYFEVEDMMNDLKKYVEHAREVLELEYDRVQAQAAGLQIAKQASPAAPPAPPAPEPNTVSEPEEPVEPETSKRSLYDLAAEMLREGRSTAEIAEDLRLSRSEIAMIQKLT